MTWADFYLVCFVVGFFLSLMMFLAGGLHLHIPHFHGHAVHIQTAHAAPAHGTTGSQVSPFNLITLTAFLAWFGGTGYLLTRHSVIWFWAALAVALLIRRLRNGRCARPALYAHSRRRHRRTDLLASRNAASVRSTCGRWVGHSENS